jgi:hypothetical protein
MRLKGVNGRLIKFFYNNRLMSQVQISKSKYCKKVMNTPTNNVEMIPLKLRTQQKKWDQSDTQIANCGQNSAQMLG